MFENESPVDHTATSRPVAQAVSGGSDVGRTPVGSTLDGTHVGGSQAAFAAETFPVRSETRFRVVRPHAKGGLGVVNVAVDGELNRTVALKELQDRFADDAGSRGRFLFEAEITGGLEHPGIVPVYGLGTYASGRPYYAMRFVKGDSLKEAIEKFHAAKLPFDSLEFRNLLGRFIAVCNAIAYAHARGILHRDIKPGNVMLGPYGETLVVDWGLAKALHAAGGADALHTLPTSVEEPPLVPLSGSDYEQTTAGMAHGTPAFMSPEQALGEVETLGPATDIYALGGTLYALVAGQLAHAGSTSRDEVLGNVIAGRFPSPKQVRADVPAPLNAVALKAMALRPDDRYARATELAADLERYLADEPVGALREPARVRARRWVRKHPGPVAGLAAAVLVGVIGLTGGLFFVNAEKNRTELARLDALNAEAKANAARDGAQLAEKRAEEQRALAQAEQRRAEDEKNTAVAVRNFLQRNLISQANVRIQGKAVTSAKHDVTVRELLAAAAGEFSPQTIGTKFPNQIPAQVEILETIGEAFEAVGDFSRAIEYAGGAVSIREASLGAHHPATIAGLTNLAFVYMSASEHSKAIGAFLKLLDALGEGAESPEKRRQIDEGSEEMLRVIRRRVDPRQFSYPEVKAVNAGAAGAVLKLVLARPKLERYVAASGERYGAEHPKTLLCRLLLGFSFHAAGQLDRAADTYRNLLESMVRALGPDDYLVAGIQIVLAITWETLGQEDAAALDLYEKSYATFRKGLGAGHPTTLGALSNLASAHDRRRNYAKALAMYGEVVDGRLAALGEYHHETLSSMGNLAGAYLHSGKVDSAIGLYERSTKGLEQSNAADELVLINRACLARAYGAAEKYALSLPLHDAVQEAMAKRFGPGHINTLIQMNNRALDYNSAGRTATAIPLYEECLKAMESSVGADHFEARNTRGNLLLALADAGDHTRAEKYLRENADRARRKFGPSDAKLAAELFALGVNLGRQRKWAEAEPPVRECAAIYAKADPGNWYAFRSQALLGGALLGQRKYAEAEPPLIAGFEGMAKRRGPDPAVKRASLIEAAEWLLAIYRATDKPDREVAWLRKRPPEVAPMPRVKP